MLAVSAKHSWSAWIKEHLIGVGYLKAAGSYSGVNEMTACVWHRQLIGSRCGLGLLPFNKCNHMSVNHLLKMSNS